MCALVPGHTPSYNKKMSRAKTRNMCPRKVLELIQDPEKKDDETLQALEKITFNPNSLDRVGHGCCPGENSGFTVCARDGW